MKELTIIKVGGNVVENEQSLSQLLNDFSAIESHKILVHGGGKIATQIGDKLGIENQMVEGRRITDAETLKVVTMVYAGLINKNIVAGLQARNCNALGLTGADMNIIRSVKRPVKKIDYGFVGDVEQVNSGILAKLIEEDIVPVIAPLTHDKKGSMLNTNADTMAQEVAVAMSKHFKVKLIYCFEKKGVLTDINNDDSYIRELNESMFKSYKEQGIIFEGMIAKLENCFTALNRGVTDILICSVEALSNPKPEGTLLNL